MQKHGWRRTNIRAPEGHCRRDVRNTIRQPIGVVKEERLNILPISQEPECKLQYYTWRLKFSRIDYTN